MSNILNPKRTAFRFHSTAAIVIIVLHEKCFSSQEIFILFLCAPLEEMQHNVKDILCDLGWHFFTLSSKQKKRRKMMINSLYSFVWVLVTLKKRIAQLPSFKRIWFLYVLSFHFDEISITYIALHLYITLFSIFILLICLDIFNYSKTNQQFFWNQSLERVTKKFPTDFRSTLSLLFPTFFAWLYLKNKLLNVMAYME